MDIFERGKKHSYYDGEENVQEKWPENLHNERQEKPIS